MDNDDVSSGASEKLDAMTSDVLNCMRCLAALSRQIALMEELRKRGGPEDAGEAQEGA